MRVFISLVLIILATACQERSKQAVIEEIVSLQSQAREAPEKEGFPYLQQADVLIKANPHLPDSLKITNHYLKGTSFRTRGLLDSAATQLFNATSLINDSIIRQEQQDIYKETWTVHRDLKNYGECMALSKKFRALVPSDNYTGLVLSYFMLEESFKYLRQLDSARYYNQRRIEALKKAGLRDYLIPAFINKAYYTYYADKDAIGTLRLLDSLVQFDKDLVPNGKRQLYGNMGVYLYYEDRKEEALASYLKGLEATKNMPERPDKIALMAYPVANISEVLIDLGRYDEAALYLDSLAQLGFDNISQNIQHSLLKYTYKLNAQTGAGPQQMVRLLDSIKYATDRQSEKKFNTEIKALTQANRNQQQLMAKNNAMEMANLKLQTRILWASLLIVILLGAVAFGYRRKLLRMDRFKLQMQQRLLRTQMSPHYTSNSLYAISRIYADKPKEASKLLLKFSRQLWQIMENSAKNSVLLEDEIEALQGYLEMQKIHFENGLSFDFEYVNLDPEDPIYILPMLIQPFVENCMEHGFKDIDYEAKVLIRLEISGASLICQIEDNGRGLVDDAWAARKNTSTQLITTYLSKTHKNPVTIANKPSVQGCGTQVTLKIPYSITHD